VALAAKGESTFNVWDFNTQACVVSESTPVQKSVGVFRGENLDGSKGDGSVAGF